MRTQAAEATMYPDCEPVFSQRSGPSNVGNDVDIVGVTGSIPVTPTIRPPSNAGFRPLGCEVTYRFSEPEQSHSPFLPNFVPKPIALGEGISWTPSIRTARALAMRRSRPLPLVRLAGEVGNG